MTTTAQKKLPLSVFIIAKNEEDRISYAINSVKGWVDEIIVIDSGSTDKTVFLAKQCGADHVLYNEWNGYGPQKTFGERLCRNNWVLNLDADEEVPNSLRKEIELLFENDKITRCSAYRIAIKFMPRFKKVSEFTPSPEEIVTRLYNKTKAGFKASKVHDSVIVHIGKTGKLKHKIMHRCFRSFTHALEKINFYTSMQAEDMFIRGRCPNLGRILIEPFWTFLRAYFVERYISLGAEGFLMSIIYSISRTVRLLKAREKFMQAELG
jgi:glycosyltransferase involved in cell wall biosynthesis